MVWQKLDTNQSRCAAGSVWRDYRMPRTPGVPVTARTYWRTSRAPRYSLLFALPLLVLYEALAALLSREGVGVRNGADVIVKDVFIAIAGPYGPILFGALLIGVSLYIIRRDDAAGSGPLRPAIFALMLAESVMLALLFGAVVGTVTAGLLGQLHAMAILMAPVTRFGWATRLMVSLGAGLYEELLFRVMLVTGIAALARRALGWERTAAGIAASVISALIFSAFHYVGPYGDRLALSSFLFRFIGGLVFSALYLLRGFGITAWTHALYDVMLLGR